MASMRFCPKCGTMLRPRRVGGELQLYCVNCGYYEVARSAEPFSVRAEVRRNPRDRILVLEPSQQPSTAQLVRGISCPKCGGDEAYFWMIQTRAADEPPTRFYRCTRCGYTWREYA